MAKLSKKQKKFLNYQKDYCKKEDISKRSKCQKESKCSTKDGNT